MTIENVLRDDTFISIMTVSMGHYHRHTCSLGIMQRYILYRDLKLLLNIDICPRYDCRSGRQVNRGKNQYFYRPLNLF